MDETSRVKNITQKFEDINNTEKNCLVGKNNQLNGSNYTIKNKKLTKVNVNLKNNVIISNLNSVNSRSNIKRTPAFRRDKVSKANSDSADETKNSVITRRINLFSVNTIENTESDKFHLPVDDRNSVKENIKLDLGDTDCHDDLNEDRTSQSVIKKENEFVTTDNVNELYTKVKKTVKNAKIMKNKKSNTDTVPTTTLQGNVSEYRRILKSKFVTDGSKKVENNVNKENKHLLMNNKAFNDIGDDLSDTLKRVLRSPLPPGPPPKKPPRTFTSTKSVIDSMLNQSTGIQYDINKNSNIISNRISENNLCLMSDISQPIRSKTESEIKLRKIENVLLKHKLALSPTTNRKVSTSPNIKVDNYASINKNRRRSSEKGLVVSLSSCVNDMNCTAKSSSVHYSSPAYGSNRSLPQFSDSHIYDDPNGLNSSSSSSKEEAHGSSLYYMSTPIDKIVKTNKLNGVITEAQNVDVKMNIPSGTIKREFCSKFPADVSVENEIKILMNKAYSRSCTKISDRSSDSDSVMSGNQEESTLKTEKNKQNVECSDQVMRIRKGYVQRVASRTITRNRSLQTPSTVDYKHLFECLLLIGLNLDSQNNKVPYIKIKYPTDINVPQWIEHMCFPDAHDWSKSIEKTTSANDFDEDQNYVTSLTTEAGLRKYVYCRRIKPEGESFSLPLSYCILSSHKANEFYFKILEELETIHGQSDMKFKKFVKELHENRFPAKGETIKISSYSEDGKVKIKEDILTRHSDSRLEDLQLAKTLDYLKINVFLLIFSNLLLERKVIFLSSSLSKLSTCIEGLQVALLPFEWQHTLITVVPSNVISVADLCDAPTPYLIGLLKSKSNSTRILPQLNNKLHVLVIDLDEKKVIRKVGDESSILPNHLVKGLKNALELAHSSEIRTNNLLACEAFTRFFVEAVGHYRRYFIYSGSDLKERKTFQKEAFVKAASSHQIRMFLEWFVETAAFSTFISIRLHNSIGSRGLFEQRCIEYFEEVNRLKYDKNNKLNKTVKQIGDLFKDWTTTSSF